MVGSNETPDASRSLIAFIKSGLDSVLEAGATGSKRSMMPRSLMKKR